MLHRPGPHRGQRAGQRDARFSLERLDPTQREDDRELDGIKIAGVGPGGPGRPWNPCQGKAGHGKTCRSSGRRRPWRSAQMCPDVARVSLSWSLTCEGAGKVTLPGTAVKRGTGATARACSARGGTELANRRLGQEDARMAWEWVGPLTTAVVALAGLGGNILISTSANRAQRALVATRHELESENARRGERHQGRPAAAVSLTTAAVLRTAAEYSNVSRRTRLSRTDACYLISNDASCDRIAVSSHPRGQ